MALNKMKCQTLARILSTNEYNSPDSIKGIVLLRQPGSGAVHEMHEMLTQENKESVVLDYTMVKYDDENMAKKLFDDLFEHQNKVVFLYMPERIYRAKGRFTGLTNAVIKAATNPVSNGRLSWGYETDVIEFSFHGSIVMLVDNESMISPDVMCNCLLVNVSV